MAGRKMWSFLISWIPTQGCLKEERNLFKANSKILQNCVQDVRKVLDNKEVDVISIATPNHWHSLMSIWACQAKKDVYVEKPLSHNLYEGRKLVEAAKKYKCIVQHGTQNRSLSKWSNLAKEIASGKRGKLEVALGTCHKRRGSIGYKDTKNPPSELDFDVWTGPAQKRGFP